jgi:agmatine/peptidylarginine deiminase
MQLNRYNFTLTLTICLLFSGPFVLKAQSQKLPAFRTETEKLLLKQQATRQVFGKAGGIVLPVNLRYPGEFEESQAVAISWADGYDDFGSPTGNVDTTYDWGLISAQLCDYIQEECPVWIRVNKATDTIRVKAFMQNRGKPLYNYRFYVKPGNGWWIRDFGPNGVYYGDKDSVAFIDLKYYPGREEDNTFPKYLAGEMNIPNFETTLNSEGGNLISDGFGMLYYSSVVTDVNTAGGVHNPVWTPQITTDSMRYLFNSPVIIETQTLECDGGTGHIDLYLKMTDEQTIFVSQYPKIVRAQDRQIIEDNHQRLTTLKSTYNRPFRIFRIPHPTGDNGKYKDTTCNQINNDARTFVNGITVNKTFIYPSYSNAQNGNKAQTDSATQLFKYLMPGYKIREIDSRALSPYGGEIHCITIQIPAENPVLFWHPSIDGQQSLRNSYHILAKISNNSGIAQATCKWRKRGAASWSTLNLSDSAGFFVGDIADASLTLDDKIEYYLTATTNNGKTAVKPITAPEGYYTVYFQTGVGIDENQVTEKDYLFGAYPNPAASQVTLPYFVMNAAESSVMSIMDLNGRKLKEYSLHPHYGLNKLELDLTGLDNGIYFYSYQTGGTYIATRKFIIAR